MELLLRSACANLVLICIYQWALSFSEVAALLPLAAAFIFHSSVFVVAACRIRLRRVNDSLRWTFITWSLVFLYLTSLLGLRHVIGVDPELIALASATWLFIVLTVAASCTCHVILHASKEWSDHLFVACTAFWWMFHDPANPWITRSGYWTLAPSILIFIVRLSDSIDRSRYSIPELIIWFCLVIVDIVWVLEKISNPWFFCIIRCRSRDKRGHGNVLCVYRASLLPPVCPALLPRLYVCAMLCGESSCGREQGVDPCGRNDI